MLQCNVQMSGWRQLPKESSSGDFTEDCGGVRIAGPWQAERASYRTFLLFFLSLCCLFLCACEKSRPLRIGLSPWPGYQFLYLAEERGFFADEGVQVRLLNFDSVGDTKRAFERGQINGMCCTLTEVLTSGQHVERKPKVAIVINCSNGSDVIVAREPITRVEELRGRTVAAQPDTVQALILIRALQQVGLSLDAVRLRSIATPEMNEAFVRGEIDAAVTYGSTAQRLARHPGAKVIFSSKALPDEIVDVLAITPDLAQARYKDMSALARALDRAIEFAQAQPEEAMRIMAKYSGATPEEFASSLEGIRMVNARDQKLFFGPDGMLKQSIERTASVLRSSGRISEAVLPSALFVDLSERSSAK